LKEIKVTILIIDDEESIRDSCSQILIKDGYKAETAEDGYKGLQKIEEVKPEMVLIDLKMPGISGMEVLEKVKDRDPHIIPIVITGYGTVESAVEAMKKGAYDFITKPFTPDELRVIVKRGLERRKLMLEAETLRREKRIMEENFITMVSHQMRSPLVAIQQYFEVILAGMTGEVEKKQREMILRAKERVESLLNLINKWLDMARINKGSILEKFASFSIKNLLEKIVEFMQPLAKENKISLEIANIDSDFIVQGDEESLEQAFSNLVNNAIKYNRPGGSVKISIEEDNNFIVVAVEDTGMGIAKEHLPFIFDQFYRVRRKEDEKIKGSGLGLSITKKIVEAHGGSIQVSSELVKGSVFKVLLPKTGRQINFEK